MKFWGASLSIHFMLATIAWAWTLSRPMSFPLGGHAQPVEIIDARVSSERPVPPVKIAELQAAARPTRGSSLVSLGAPPGSGAEDSEMNSVLVRIRNAIETRVAPLHPTSGGELLLRLSVSPSGELRSLEVVRSDLPESMRQAALSSVRAAAPFEAFRPSLARSGALSLLLPIEFRRF